MSRRAISVIGIVLLAIVVSVATGGWWYMAKGRFAFAGDTTHDFGQVAVLGRSVAVEHTFVLRNRRSVPVTIITAKASCGCTDIVPPSEPIEPGETIELPVTLNLSAAGHKGASIQLLLDDDTTQMLFVEAVGIRRERLTISTKRLALVRDEPMPLTITYELQDPDATPPDPQAAAPDGVEVEFKGWELMTEADRKGRAAKWRGLFEVVLRVDELPANAPMPLGVGEEPPVVVRFTVKP